MKRYSKEWWLPVLHCVAAYAQCLAAAFFIVFCLIFLLAAYDGAIEWPRR